MGRPIKHHRHLIWKDSLGRQLHEGDDVLELKEDGKGINKLRSIKRFSLPMKLDDGSLQCFDVEGVDITGQRRVVRTEDVIRI